MPGPEDRTARRPDPDSALELDLSISARVLEATLALGQAVSAELEMEALCDLIIEHLQGVFGAESVALLFLDEESGELHEKRSLGPYDDRMALVREHLSGGRDAAGIAHDEQRLIRWEGHEAGAAEPVSLPAGVALPLQREPEEMARRAATAAVPLVAESKVKGVVVLTWSPEAARPTDEDSRMLEVLGAQVAAAIDNAWLYGEIHQLNTRLEEKVRERTHELEQAQLQLVQSEKMASLGQLTAGIAHEINNPLAYVISNVAMARERAVVLDSHARVLACLVDFWAEPAPARRLEIASALIESLADSPRFREDVVSFLSERDALEEEAAVALSADFLGYLRLSHEELIGSPERELGGGVARLLDRSHEGLERVKQIVLDLRSFSRLDEAQFQEADLDASIAGTLSIVEHLAKDRQVTLVQERGLEAPYACFPAKINQVVLNLVTNALQATPPGGTVTVRTGQSDAGPTLEIRDTGKGIPEEELGRIFDPFYTTKPVGQGTGLGLSISYKIIEEHGGSIRVTSQLGEGTRFHVQLPSRG